MHSITTFTWHCLMRTKQKETPNFSIVVMEVNKLSTHLGAHPTVHVNEVNVATDHYFTDNVLHIVYILL
jgi:hypothetical protein